MTILRIFSRAMAGAALAGAAGLACAADMPGVGDTEIKLGHTAALSGPAAMYGLLARTNSAYFQQLNEQGGINGRKINLIVADDEYIPNKSFDAVRKLVERDKVALMYGSFGTLTNSAQAPYLNRANVPHLFVATGADKWGDTKALPWSMGFQPSFRQEARIYTQHAIQGKADVKIGVLFQNDDFGSDYLKGVQDVLASARQAKLVKEASYETSDASVDSQLLSLRAAGADVIVLAAIPKFAGQAIRKAYDIQWNTTMYVALGAAGLSATTEFAKGRTGITLLSGAYLKDARDPAWDKDSGMLAYRAFMQKYLPREDVNDPLPVMAVSTGALIAQVLRQAGSDLSRANILRQAESLRNLQLPMVLPGIVINTAKDDHYLVEQLRLTRWVGDKWQAFGEVLSFDPKAGKP